MFRCTTRSFSLSSEMDEALVKLAIQEGKTVSSLIVEALIYTYPDVFKDLTSVRSQTGARLLYRRYPEDLN